MTLKIVATASDVMPDYNFVGYDDDPRSSTVPDPRFQRAIVTCDNHKKMDVCLVYDLSLTSLMRKRTESAHILGKSREIAALGFSVEKVLHLRVPKNAQQHKTHRGKSLPIVCITEHVPGTFMPLATMNLQQCAAIGAAIGAIHRIPATAKLLRDNNFPIFTSEQIHKGLQHWIAKLAKSQQLPQEIIDRWKQMIDLEGLWEFNTCPVHGGFADGDVSFTHSGVEAMTNWEQFQVNDPARDLAWIFELLSQEQQDAVLASYGRVVGNKMDDCIVPRAKLWVQMHTVADFMKALQEADSEKIRTYKQTIDNLAESLHNHTQPKTTSHGGVVAGAHTITVGNLLHEAHTIALPKHTGEQSTSQTPQGNDDETMALPTTTKKSIKNNQPTTHSEQQTAPHSHDDATQSDKTKASVQITEPDNQQSSNTHDDGIVIDEGYQSQGTGIFSQETPSGYVNLLDSSEQIPQSQQQHTGLLVPPLIPPEADPKHQTSEHDYQETIAKLEQEARNDTSPRDDIAMLEAKNDDTSEHRLESVENVADNDANDDTDAEAHSDNSSSVDQDDEHQDHDDAVTVAIAINNDEADAENAVEAAEAPQDADSSDSRTTSEDDSEHDAQPAIADNNGETQVMSVQESQQFYNDTVETDDDDDN